MDEFKYNIVCLSNQLWDFPNWTNKRHVMSRLAKRGFNVLFVDPPLTTGRVLFRQIRKGNWSLVRSFTSVKRDEGVKVFSPLNYLPFFGLLSRFDSLPNFPARRQLAAGFLRKFREGYFSWFPRSVGKFPCRIFDI